MADAILEAFSLKISVVSWQQPFVRQGQRDEAGEFADLFLGTCKIELHCYLLSPDAIDNKKDPLKTSACSSSSSSCNSSIDSSSSNHGAFTSAFKALHTMVVAYISGVIPHHLLTHTPVQLDISLSPPPCSALILSVTAAMPTAW